MTDLFVAHVGVRLHVRVVGDGAPVVVLHGFTGSIETMHDISDALATTRRVVAVDLLGHGMSDAPVETAAYAMEAEASRLLAVLDHLRFATVDVVGFSMGGRVALSLGVAAPQRISSLVLIGARAGFTDGPERAARVGADAALANRVETVGVAAFVDEFYSQPMFASRCRLGQDALAADRQRRLQATPQGLAGSLRGAGAGAMAPLQHDLGGLTVPTLLVVGEEDDVRFHTAAAEIAALAPETSVAIVPGAGHAAHMENPAAVLDATKRFWGTLLR